MSRHRDVRCMNYSEEYEGYDDVYGHSVEDDYCVSPSAEQFLFDRSKQQNIASFITEPDIIEDNEDNEESIISSNEEDVVLTEIERAKLMSCMESIKNVIGDTVLESEIKKKIIQANFDAEVALDSILRESSPKNVTGPSTADKNNLEPHPDAASISFIIPKLSFNKQNDTESTNKNACLVNNSESLTNLSIGNSPIRFPSLSGFITSPVNSTLPNFRNDPLKNISGTGSFKSLADLTAHHLQKSGNCIGSANSNEKTFLSKTNFVIPKLSIKRDNCSGLNDAQLDCSVTERNIIPNVLNDRKIDDCMDSLERSLSNVLALTDPNTKKNSQSIESKEDSILSGIRTPSPDPWMIDLSAALKEAAVLASDNCCGHEKSKVTTSFNNVIPNSNLHDSDKNLENPCLMLPTTLNQSCLKYAKLSHSKKNVSLFGRTLCRTWKLRKPILKISSKDQHYQTVKRFDFSVPYSRTQ